MNHDNYYHWFVRRSLHSPRHAQWCATLFDQSTSEQVGKTWRFKTWREAMDWAANLGTWAS